MSLTFSLLSDSAWRITHHRGEIGWGIVLRLGKFRLAIWGLDLATRTSELLFQREALAEFAKSIGYSVFITENGNEKTLHIQESTNATK